MTNIWNELGFDAAESRTLEMKSRLLSEIVEKIRSLELSQAKVAALLGLQQPHVSELLKGKMSRFGLEKLINIAERLDLHVDMRIEKKAANG